MKHLTILAVVFSLCAGCAVFSPQKRLVKLERGYAVCVAVPDDGALLLLKTYPETGMATAQMFQEAFRPYASDVVLVQAGEKELFESARSMNARYLLVPKISSWEKIRFWRFRRNAVSLRVVIYDVIADTAIIKDRIVVRTMESFNTPHPQEMIGRAIKSFIISLY